MSQTNQVIISIHGGVAELVRKPSNVEVVLRDYDVQGSEAAGLKRDADGTPYLESVRPAIQRKR